ncbi:Sodium/hydrogen exchanger 9B2 [Blattella germanica]|nr:Sodium/hydrogen exchanger 9B2 [Blattella germanica]
MADSSPYIIDVSREAGSGGVFQNHTLTIADLISKPLEKEDNPKVSTIIGQKMCCSCCCLVKAWNAITSHPFCPPKKKIARFLTLLTLGFLIWGSLYSMIPSLAGPKGQLFKIGVLGIASHMAGWLIGFTGLPPLLGMLVMGILLRNIGFVQLHDEFQDVAADLRQMALSIILIRAGMGLDPVALKRLGGLVSRLAIGPSLAEACFAAIMSHFFLGLPWVWGFLLGAVLAAVSPAVVIPCLFSLQDRGYGKSKGIPTLVIAAASFDDIIAISAFGVVYSLIFNSDDLIMQIIRGPLGILFGIIGGIALGYFLRYVPHSDDKRVSMLRTVMLLGTGIMFMFGSDAIGYEGAGPLGGIVTAFVASNGWNTETFNGKARIITSVFVAAGGNLTWKEKLFISFAWFPKATVQAAIGPLALDAAREMGSEEYKNYANKVLIVAVLGILITAPVGASLITFLGPKLLKKEPILNTTEDRSSTSSTEIEHRIPE